LKKQSSLVEKNEEGRITPMINKFEEENKELMKEQDELP